MSLVKVSDRIWYLPFEEETDRPCLYYIRGEKCSAAVDAGNSRAHVEKFYTCLREAGLPLPQHTFITHWHWDHTFGLPYIHGTSWAGEKTNLQLDRVRQWVWTREAMLQREKTGEDIHFCNEKIMLEYEQLSQIRVRRADNSVKQDMTMDLGGVHLRAIPCDSIHSRDALLVFLPEERALFIGDADCKDHYSCGGGAQPERIVAFEKLLKQLDFDLLLIGHDLPDVKQAEMQYLQQLQKEFPLPEK